MNSVFISYSNKDRDFVSKLAFDLKNLGINVWFDQWDLKVGDSITSKIADAIKAQDYLIAVLSRSSVNSSWVQKELNTGLMRELEEKRVFVLPIIIESCAIPFLLSDKIYADFRKDYSLGLNKLLEVFPNSLFPSGLNLKARADLSNNIVTGNIVSTNVIDTIGKISK